MSRLSDRANFFLANIYAAVFAYVGHSTQLGIGWFLSGLCVGTSLFFLGLWLGDCEEKAMAREYGARMTRPLDDAQRAALNDWLQTRRHDREGD